MSYSLVNRGPVHNLLQDYAADDRYIYIATELLEGNLTSYLQYLGSVGPGECQRHTPRLVWQLFSAVSLLHGEGRVHTWLKVRSGRVKG